MKDDVLSQVIVNVRDLTFMNALETIFTSSTNLLCLFHITKNVNTKCKIHMNKVEEWQDVMDAWELLLQSLDKESYNELLKRFTNWWTCYKIFVDYVQNTWLKLFKEKLVQAWVDRVMHLGNTTTNSYLNSFTLIIS